ncbi:MAG: Bug family tripartite tricarboxylate transporter substrate binding protein [Candidatus Binatia bacterium]
MKRFALSLSLLFALALVGPNIVIGADDFYKGKTIRLIVGNSTGGAMDDWGRFVALYLGKHIPGNPDVVVQNMPGAGAIIAANYIYNIAKPDGLTLGVVNPANYIDQLLGSKEVKFDWPKFTWIGSPERVDQVLFMRTDAYKTLDELRAAKEPPRCAALARAGLGYLLPRLIEETLGVKLNMVLGYGGGGDMNLAIEKGEVQCRAGTVSAYVGREPTRTWIKNGFVRALTQSGTKRYPKLPDTPTIYELMDQHKTADTTKRLARVVLSSGELGRPFIAPPAMAPDRIKILRDAFNKALTDPALVADAQKRKWDLDPLAGEELEATAKEIMVQPREVIERMKKLLEG